MWLKYWDAEHQFPKWFVDAHNVWLISLEDYLDFCRQCWKVYEIAGCGLLFVEKVESGAEIHLSIVRGADIMELTKGFIEVRRELLDSFDMIFGWVLRQNRGLQRICQQLGMEFYGVKMLHGSSHGKVLEWRCYSMRRGDFFLSIDNRSLLSLT